MGRRLVITGLIILGCLGAKAQGWKLENETLLTFEVTHSSLDRSGNIYLADSRGNIRQYNSDGELLNLYSTKLIGQIYLLESWHGLRTFAFYQDLQEYMLTDRFLANERNYQLSPQYYIRLATLSQDLNLWTLSEDNLIIRKINAFDGTVMIENQWNNDYSDEYLNISYVKEYKNRLYFLDAGTRVMVFDNLGNPITIIPTPGAKTISFANDQLLANTGEETIKVDLLSLEREILTLPVDSDHVYLIDESFFLVDSGKLLRYSYSPL